ncbi:hypothetical protein TorRG33x02_290810 [Trema orientale]|uniref:Uncharacterized protein n=1 Tax=Trema orientale TaxID=63057 RepID=A0A2P5CC09_TREOI|nr:hypothetical protein TorRG33x02_290810 [Trema orientale]
MSIEKNLRMITILFLFNITFVMVGLCIDVPLNINGAHKVVGVGVILDLDSRVGEIARDYLHMALSDFYAEHANYQTRLALSIKNSGNDVVLAASEGKVF